MDLLPKTKNENKYLKKQEIQNMFIETNQIKFALTMTCLMQIYLEEKSQLNCYMIILQEIRNVMGNNAELLQWIMTDKSTNLINQQQKNLLWQEQLKLHQTKNEQ